MEVENGQGGGGVLKLKIGFNLNDNPYVVANKFVKENDLPDVYLEEIVQFIQKNGGGVGAGLGAELSNSVDANKGGKPRVVSFPLLDGLGLVFDNISTLDKIKAKIIEFNNDPSMPASSKLSESEMSEISKIFEILRNTSKYHSTSFTDVQCNILLKKLLKTWEIKQLFPIYDLIRAMLCHSDFGSNRLIDRTGFDFFVDTCNRVIPDQNVSSAVLLTSVRALANMFRFPNSNKGTSLQEIDFVIFFFFARN